MMDDKRRYYNEGWCWPLETRKAHYFRGGKSLCGEWKAIVGLKLSKKFIDITLKLRPEPHTVCKMCLQKL